MSRSGTDMELRCSLVYSKAKWLQAQLKNTPDEKLKLRLDSWSVIGNITLLQLLLNPGIRRTFAIEKFVT
jgi:hypothetical protein